MTAATPSSTWKVLRTHKALRWYLFTCICKDIDDWLVRVANLIVIQEWAGTGVALSQLVLSALLPKAIFGPFGGVLADQLDRRHLMIVLDALAGVVVLGFLAAVYYKSIPILLAVTCARSAISAMYYPVVYGFLPLLIPDNQDLQYAGTAVTSVFGLMSMLGGLMAGSTAVALGMRARYAIDSITYFLSSLAMLLFISGDYRGQFNETR
ncbi:hypothetical protein ACA910_005276 [Epithemia clementina (nom. ined.)]